MRSTRADLTSATWRKSTYSDGGGGDCLEIATSIPDTVPVRDSKNPTGPMLLLGPAAWGAFIEGVRQTAH
jgi:hypothetical protein